MSLQFLQRIAFAFAFSTDKPGEIDHIAILRAGGLVLATVRRSLSSAHYAGSATVRALIRIVRHAWSHHLRLFVAGMARLGRPRSSCGFNRRQHCI